MNTLASTASAITDIRDRLQNSVQWMESGNLNDSSRTALLGVADMKQLIEWIDDAAPTTQPTGQAVEPSQPAAERGEQPIGEPFCPITGRPFFGNWEHPERGMVAIYGGPFDSYTIPHLEDGELRCERYDQDAGEWVEGGEPVATIETERASRTPAPAAPDWQPIKTAPKDGSDFLAWTLRCGALVVYWQTAVDDPYWSDGMSRTRWEFSHWMPLPARPAAIAFSTKASGGAS